MVDAFVFPGQGSQQVGMLSCYMAEPAFIAVLQRASTALNADLIRLIKEGPEAILNETRYTQPALLACSVALYGLWCERGGREPALLAGHSLGEYSALVCAGSLELEEAVVLVAERGRLMQEAVPQGEGLMAAVLGLEDDDVIQACLSVDDEYGSVQAVNFNMPGQVVMAGNRSAVEVAMAACKARGAKRVLALPVSVPAHSRLMKPAANALAHALSKVKIRMPSVMVLHNIDAQPAQDESDLRRRLLEQLYSPVQWVRTMQEFQVRGVTELYECGPGRVLSGLAKRMPAFTVWPLDVTEALQQALDHSCVRG
ncbi:MAG: ACP S-malonyltransferase [Pseudomonadales bacterium]|nr:ACP S-malonyltransferase [Pseudomonadales bacterium]